MPRQALQQLACSCLQPTRICLTNTVYGPAAATFPSAATQRRQLQCAPSTETGLEMLGGAEADEAAGGHDAQARAQGLALLHAVAGQHYRVPCHHSMCSRQYARS